MTSTIVASLPAGAQPPAGVPSRSRRALGRPTPQAALKLRKSFLDEALNAFLEHGDAGASVNSIASAAGVSKATVYRVFGDKQQIFLAAAERGCEWAYNSLQSAIDSGDTPERVLWKVTVEKQRGVLRPRALATARPITLGDFNIGQDTYGRGIDGMNVVLDSSDPAELIHTRR